MEQRRRRLVGVQVLVALALVAFSGLASAATLRMVDCWDGPRQQIVDDMLVEFSAANPDIKVERQVVACNQLPNRYSVEWMGGVAPDLIMLDSKDVLAMGLKGALLPLDDLLKKAGIGDDYWLPSEIELGRYEGVTYGLPIRTGADAASVIFYNKDHFDEAGVPDAPPALWDDLLRISQKLVKYDGDKILRNPWGSTMEYPRWIGTGGATLLSPDLKTVTFASPASIAAAEWIMDYISRVFRNPAHWAGHRNEFLKGTASMIISGPFEMQYATTAPNLRYGFGPAPLKGTGKEYFYLNYGTYDYAITRTTKFPDAAWKLLHWLTIRPESAGEFMIKQGRPSPIRKVNSDPRYLEINAGWPALVYIHYRAMIASRQVV